MALGLCLSTFLAVALGGDDKGASSRRPARAGATSGPELIDPIVVADEFAGQTVKDQEMGQKLIQARGSKVPKVGQIAPDFELRTADGKKRVRLSSFRGKKPVVLIFGSHT
jgi:hypothetical protein